MINYIINTIYHNTLIIFINKCTIIKIFTTETHINSPAKKGTGLPTKVIKQHIIAKKTVYIPRNAIEKSFKDQLFLLSKITFINNKAPVRKRNNGISPILYFKYRE